MLPTIPVCGSEESLAVPTLAWAAALPFFGPFGRWPHADVQPDFLVPPLSLFRRGKGQYECSGRPKLFLAVTILE